MMTGWKKGALRLLVMALVVAVTLATAGFGLHQAENLTGLHHWVRNTGGFWLLWRLGIYAALGWGSWKIGRRVKHWAEYRNPLLRMVLFSLLVILLGEYALCSQAEATP
jgi:hypothetical protein